MREATDEQSLSVDFTGERVVPGRVEPELWHEHIARYYFALQFADGKAVLDAGCGTGYGLALLAERASAALGFDISEEAIEYARHHYAERARFLVGAADQFPVEGQSQDLVTAFEVIEHIERWPRLIEEAHRVLRDDGLFLVSTPNKVYYSEARAEIGPNPFHVHEFEHQEFFEVLNRVFPYVTLVAQNRQEAFVFANEGSGSALSGQLAMGGDSTGAHFFVALCSKVPVQFKPFVYVPDGGNLLRERERHIRSLEYEVSHAQEQHAQLMAKHDELRIELERQNNWARGLDDELTEARQRLALEQANTRELADWGKKVTHELEEKSEQLKIAYERVQEAEDRVKERTEWALRLQDEVNAVKDQVLNLEDQHHSNQQTAQQNQYLQEESRKLGEALDRLTHEHTRALERLEIRNLSLGRLQVQFGMAARAMNRLLDERECVRRSRWLKLGRLFGIGPRLKDDPL